MKQPPNTANPKNEPKQINGSYQTNKTTIDSMITEQRITFKKASKNMYTARSTSMLTFVIATLTFRPM